MTKRNAPIAMALMIFVLPAVTVFAELTLLSPEECRQGSVVELVAITDTRTVLRTARLVSSGGDSISSNVFFIIDRTSTHRIWASLLAVSPTQAADTATVEAFGAISDETPAFARRIRIKTHSFASEIIDLNGEMSNLRQSRDPRRIRESRELWELLIRVDDDAIYHFGKYLQPLSGARVTSHYGERRRFVYKDGGTDNSVHSGIDLAILRGTAVVSTGAGRIAFAGDRILTGNTVVIEHLPGVYSLYYHLDSYAVVKDDRVKQGEVIGAVGDTGLVTGVHLHWEMRVAGIPIDPDDMLNLQILDKAAIMKQITAN